MIGRRRVAAALSSLLVAVALIVGPSATAEAHRLKLFVTVENGEIGGYAFFVGGGRPEEVDVRVKDAAGTEIFAGKTDDRGAFRWRPPAAADYTVVVDTGDGHWTEARIAADRLADLPTSPAAGPTAVAPTPTPPASAASPPIAAAACPTALDPNDLSKRIERAVDTALARQLRPLMEAWDQAEGRIRFNDVMGGIGMIVGLAGAALWTTARRRRPDEEPKP